MANKGRTTEEGNRGSKAGDIGQIAGTAIGAIGGFMVGGPVGAVVGAKAGGDIGAGISGGTTGKGGLGKTAQGVDIASELAALVGTKGKSGGFNMGGGDVSGLPSNARITDSSGNLMAGNPEGGNALGNLMQSGNVEKILGQLKGISANQQTTGQPQQPQQFSFSPQLNLGIDSDTSQLLKVLMMRSGRI